MSYNTREMSEIRVASKIDRATLSTVQKVIMGEEESLFKQERYTVNHKSYIKLILQGNQTGKSQQGVHFPESMRKKA